MLGLPAQPDQQAELDRENEEHQDLVQGNFLDTYYNPTFKSVMGSYIYLLILLSNLISQVISG